MKQKGKQNLLNSVKFTGERENIYQDSGEKDNMNKIKVPKKYDKFSIHQIRKEFEQNNAYTENQSKHVARNIIRSAAKTNSNSDYNSDYLLDDHSVFKITFDKDSTTVTDMGNSGFSFTEVRSSFDRRMGRSMSFDAKSKQDSLQHILPVINQYRRMMKSPGSISEHHTRAGIPIIL